MNNRSSPTNDENISDLTPSEYYVVIRKAVQDGIVGATWTIVLVLLGIYLIFFGVFVSISSSGTSVLQTAGGIFVVIVGGYFALSALGIIPTLEEYVG